MQYSTIVSLENLFPFAHSYLVKNDLIESHRALIQNARFTLKLVSSSNWTLMTTREKSILDFSFCWLHSAESLR